MAERIASLVPAATETLFALGVGETVVAVSHACDHPPEVDGLPEATRTRVDPSGGSREIDASVRQTLEAGTPLYEVLGEVLHHARPGLVIAQEACEVCGVTPVDVEAALSRIEPVERPEVLALHPHTLDDVLEDVQTLADHAGVPDAGETLVDELRARIDAVDEHAASTSQRPRTLVLDWLDPPMVAGHWVPEMVELAGGDPVLVEPGEPSREVDWTDVVDADPEVLVAAPCGFDRERARREARALARRDGWAALTAARQGRVRALDASAYTSRPGPRLVDGLEQLAVAVHPGTLAEVYPTQADRVTPLE